MGQIRIEYEKGQDKGIHRVKSALEYVIIDGTFMIGVPEGYSYTFDARMLGKSGIGAEYVFQIQKTNDERFWDEAEAAFNLAICKEMITLKASQTLEYPKEVFDIIPSFPGPKYVFKKTDNIAILVYLERREENYSKLLFLIFVKGIGGLYKGEISIAKNWDEAIVVFQEWLESFVPLTLSVRYSYVDWCGNISSKTEDMLTVDGDIQIPIPKGFKGSTDANEINGIFGGGRSAVVIPSNCSYGGDIMAAPVALSILKNPSFSSNVLSKRSEFPGLVTDTIMVQMQFILGNSIAYILKNDKDGCVFYKIFPLDGGGIKARGFILSRTNGYEFHLVDNSHEDGENNGSSAISRLNMIASEWLTKIIFNEGKTMAAGAQRFLGSNEDFKIDENGVLTKYKGNASEVIIPEGVKKIGDWAFRDFGQLTSIKLSETLVGIGRCAFSNCGLTEVDFPEGLETIGDSAFDNCKQLKRIKLPATLREIREYAFFSCEKLEMVALPAALLVIGDSAFQYCEQLREISLPLCLQEIGKEAFFMNKMTDIVIPSGVKVIGEDAFYGCDELKRVIILDGVREMGKECFNCHLLRDIYIPGSVAVIGDGAVTTETKETVIHTVKGSAAEAYAEKNGIKFDYDYDRIDESGVNLRLVKGIKTGVCQDIYEKLVIILYEGMSYEEKKDEDGNRMYEIKVEDRSVSLMRVELGSDQVASIKEAGLINWLKANDPNGEFTGLKSPLGCVLVKTRDEQDGAHYYITYFLYENFLYYYMSDVDSDTAAIRKKEVDVHTKIAEVIEVL